MKSAVENTMGIVNSAANTSFLSGLFTFDKFITARLVKILYKISVALILLVTIGGGALGILVLRLTEILDDDFQNQRKSTSCAR